MGKPKPNRLRSIMLKDLKVGDRFKTSPTYGKHMTFWQVVEIKHYPVPTPAGFPKKMETKILAQSLNSSLRKQLIGSNLAVYIED